jgi:hypothetical protein
MPGHRLVFFFFLSIMWLSGSVSGNTKLAACLSYIGKGSMSDWPSLLRIGQKQAYYNVIT